MYSAPIRSQHLRVCSCSALVQLLFLVAMAPSLAFAQAKPAESDSTAPKVYDINNDGRIDAKDEAAVRLVEREDQGILQRWVRPVPTRWCFLHSK